MSTEDKLRNTTWEALFTAHTRLMREFQSGDMWSDISMREYDVLYQLSKSDSPLRLTTLKDRVLLSQPALSRLVDRLIDRGLVERGVDPCDRRAVSLTLSQKGRELQRAAGRAHAKDISTHMSVLSTAELEQLSALCTKLVNTERK